MSQFKDDDGSSEYTSPSSAIQEESTGISSTLSSAIQDESTGISSTLKSPVQDRPEILRKRDRLQSLIPRKRRSRSRNVHVELHELWPKLTYVYNNVDV